MRKSRFAIALFVALFATLGLFNTVFAEMPPAAIMAQMKSGTITAVGKDDIQIDGSTYRIMEQAVIVDDEGQPLSVEEIRPTGLVKYLLKTGLIESMIVTNPQ